jgi:hypothetical protein
VAYFSDREQGPKPRTGTEITEGAWKGIVIAIGRRVTDGSFGQSFPEMCDDGRGPVGTNEKMLRDAIESEIPDLEWPWRGRELPSTYDALDFIEFCYRHIASPIKGDWHPFFGHHHLDFEPEPGKTEFREQINTIFARNGLAFDLTAEGQIVRLAPVVLDKALVGAVFKTGDAELDKILETARKKFLSPNIDTRKESLEKLWDAFERLKTLEIPADKKKSADKLLTKASSRPEIKKLLDDEFGALTGTGNTFMIRHTEKGKIPIDNDVDVDYLFHRMFAVIRRVLKATKRGG